MVFTLTLNPSLDYFLSLDCFNPAQSNRARNEFLLPGGKGINVSLMLQKLGIESKMLGFLAGFSGAEIQRRLQELHAQEDFIFLQEGCSRINIKIFSQEESEINAIGPTIPKEKIQELCGKLQEVREEDFLILSGSLPQGVPCDFYARAMRESKSQRVILDCTGEAMEQALRAKPFLIKPNQAEVEEIFGLSHLSLEDLKRCAFALQEKGARNVLVSMGKEGAFLLKENQEFHFCRAPQGKPLNPVGAGDSMIAGIITGLERGFGLQKAFLYAIACGSASAFSQGFATHEEVETIFKNLIKEEK